ncbi:hypothetical protein HispidOSU_010764 [Sigmodon hispidus]
MAQKPPPPEEENPRVKCRDCGAFGHTWQSKTCPIKFHSRLPEPQPLGGSRMDKENQDPRRTQNLQTAVTESQPERDKKLRQHPVFQGDRCFSKGSFWAPGKKSSQGTTLLGQNPQKKPRVTSSITGDQGPAETRAVKTQPQFLARGLRTQGKTLRTSKDKSQMPSLDNPQLQSRAALVSERPCTEGQEPSPAQGAVQPLRMIFTRHPGDRRTCRFLGEAPGLKENNATPPSETPASQKKGVGTGSKVSWSVLYEDLLVSSSEDSDGE